MVVMGVWAFILFIGHRWRNWTKEQPPWNNTKQSFPEQKTKKSFAQLFCFTSSVSSDEVLSGIWNPLISGQIVNGPYAWLRQTCKFHNQAAYSTLRNETKRNETVLCEMVLCETVLCETVTTQCFITPYLEYLEFHWKLKICKDKPGANFLVKSVS